MIWSLTQFFLLFDSDLANRVPSPLFIFECIHSFCFVLFFVRLFYFFSFSYSRAMSTLLVTMTARTRVFDREHLCKTRSFFSSLYESSLGGWALKIGKVTLNNVRFMLYIIFFKKYFICLKNWFQACKMIWKKYFM